MAFGKGDAQFHAATVGVGHPALSLAAVSNVNRATRKLPMPLTVPIGANQRESYH